MYRWNYKGDDGIILSNEWRIMIHQGLQAALSLGKRQDNYIQAKQPPQVGDIKEVFVDSINKSFLNVHFEHYGKMLYGYIHISNIKDEYIDDLFELFKKDDVLFAKIIGYDKKYSKWSLVVSENDF